MTSILSSTTEGNSSTNSRNSNERLLEQIENELHQNGPLNNVTSYNSSADHNNGGDNNHNNHKQHNSSSVATSDLLDMLEKEVCSKHNLSMHGGTTTSSNREAPQSGGSYSDNDAQRGRKNNNRRHQSSGYYSSGDISGSFTSKLLGGQSDLLDDNDNEGEGEEYYANNINADNNNTHDDEGQFIPSIDNEAVNITNIANYASSTTNSSGGKSSENSYNLSSSPNNNQASAASRRDSFNLSDSGGGGTRSPYLSDASNSKNHASLGKFIYNDSIGSVMDFGRDLI